MNVTPNQPNVLGYADHLEHLADELAALDLLIRLRIARTGAPVEPDPRGQLSRAVYVTDEEAERLLTDVEPDRPAGPAGTDQAAGPTAGLAAQLAERTEQIAARVAQSRDVRLPLLLLARQFGLSEFEQRALVICLAPELRRKYDRLYAYLQDDITRKRPSVELILALLCPDEAERWRHHELLTDGARLIRGGLLEPVDDPASPSGASDLSRFLRLDPRIHRFLLGMAAGNPRLPGGSRPEPVEPGAVHSGPPGAADDEVDRETVTGLTALLAARLAPAPGPRRPLVVHLRGPAGAGARAIAARACAALGIGLLRFDARALAGADDGPQLVRQALREGLLQQCAIHLAGADALLGDQARAARSALTTGLVEFGGPVFLAGTGSWLEETGFGPGGLCVLAIPEADARARAACWRRALAGQPEADEWAQQLGQRYRLTPGRIRTAVESARLRLLARPEPAPLTLGGLARECREQSDRALGELALKIEPRYGWGDLVLPAEQLAMLHEICAQIRYQHLVFDNWGFAGRVRHGRGLSALFSGPPGTGKTLAAEVIARAAGLDLYKVDLAGVVSKYIGETERNLARIFAEAATSNAVLFFDEADALFGKRSEVSDAHDRYANIEISYLLQRMEDYEGVVVLATNLRQNLDEAFTRRIRFLVDFPFPDAADRLRIWRAHLPAGAPVSPDVDWARLAREFPVSGGSIKNIVLSAAFLAASDGASNGDVAPPIGERHLLHGVRREFAKVGKIWSPAEPRLPVAGRNGARR